MKAPPREEDLAATGAIGGDAPDPRARRWLAPPWSWLWLGLLLAMLASGGWLALFQSPHPDPGRTLLGNATSWSWWIWPLERNAALRTRISGELHAVHALPASNLLWAVGQDGLILHSDDGGATWTRQTAPSPDEPRTGEPPPQQQQAPTTSWLPISSAHAAIETPAQPKKRSSNLPDVPVTQGFPPEDEALTPIAERTTLRGVFFIDARQGWAVGDAGRIIATRDGGLTWQNQDSGVENDLNAVRFADARTGWVVGHEGRVLRTDDGGASWTRIEAGAAEALMALHLADADRLWAAGWNGTVIFRSPAGWQPQPRAVATALRGVAFASDALRGWAVGDGGRVLRTADGGQTWSQTQATAALAVPGLASRSGAAPGLRSVAMSADGRDVWMVGENGLMLASHDGGSTLETQFAPGRARLNGVSFSDSERGWAVGEGGTLLATLDGGRRWFAQSNAAPGENDAGNYARYPSPLALLMLAASACGLALLIGWGRFRRTPGSAPTAAAASALSSDQPAQQLADDRLGHADTVIALSEFIRNADTQPRVTIAVTAPWGRGKSSIMRMLQADLERNGFHTAWFNAWHHQQEGRPLSALFNTIRSQVLPPGLGGLLARLRVRLRLNWGRGWLYRGAVLLALGAITFVLADIVKSNDSLESFADRVAWRVSHELLDEPRVVLSPRAMAALDPFREPPKSAPQCTACDPACADKAPASALRPALFCYMQRAVVWQPDNVSTFCNDPQGNCEFRKRETLLKTIEAGARMKLHPGEREAIAKAAEPLPPPGLAPFVEKALALMLPLLALIIGKGITVYGLQILKPLEKLVGANGAGEGKEATGTVERYRVEFANLTEAVSGRLVIFIDDLDRCNDVTVNSLLEMTNYLVDVGRCFIVIGADLKHVKACILPPAGTGDRAEGREEYASRYLRKLVHIEIPVPESREDTVRRLLGGSDESPPPHSPLVARAIATLRAVGSSAGILLAVASVLFVVWGATRLADMKRDDVPRIEALAAADAQADRPESAFSAPDARGDGGGAGPVGLEVADGDTTWAWSLAIGAVGFALLLGWLLRRSSRLRQQMLVTLGGAVRVTDSADFRTALELWHGAVFARDGTPRGSKRFRNKARFFGTLLAREFGAAYGAERMRVHAVALVAMNFVAPDLLDRLMSGSDPASTSRLVADHLKAFRERLAMSAGDPEKMPHQETAADCFLQHVEAFGGLAPELVRSFIGHARSIEVR